MGHSARKVALLSPCGFGNLGDAAIQEAVIQAIRKRSPDAEILGLTGRPDDTERRHHIPSFPLGSNSRHRTGSCLGGEVAARDSRDRNDPGGAGSPAGASPSRRGYANPVRLLAHKMKQKIHTIGREVAHIVSGLLFLRGSDLLVVSGGGQLDELWGGPWGQPYALFKWSITARILRVKVVFVSVGVGTIRSTLGKWFIASALSRACYRSYRDGGSKQLLPQPSRFEEDPVFPDLAFSLPVPELSADGRATVVGIGPMPYCEPTVWPEKDPRVYETYIEELARFVSALITEGNTILLYPGQIHQDRVAVDALCEALDRIGPRGWRERVSLPPIHTVYELICHLSRVELVVASRFHGVLLPLLLGKPVLAISHERKVTSLMSEMGLDEYCLDIRRIDSPGLKQRFHELRTHSERVSSLIRVRALEYRSVLDTQYDMVFASSDSAARA